MLTNFLQQIVPDDSIICLARSRSQENAAIGRPKLNFNNVFFTPAELDHAERVVTSWNEKQDTEVYFALAGYATKSSRKKTNVSLLQSLFMDVDLWSEKLAAQPGKKKADFYLTKAEALRGLKKFMLAVPAMPQPIVVDSGRGLHVYFLLDTALPPARWEPLAAAFRDTVRQHEPKLAGDPVRMCDSASVLRLPGSTNAKEPGNKLPVKVLINGANRADYEVLMAALGGAATIGLPLPPDWAKGSNDFEVGYQGKREFKDIEPRPVLTGCLQMKHHLETKGAVSEPEWLLACRVFVTLRNGHSIAHRFSNPAFKGAIDRKLKHAATNFDAPSAACKEWPDQTRCDSCSHRGNVLFAAEIAKAATEQREVEEAISKAVAEAAQVAVQPATVPGLPVGHIAMPKHYEQVIAGTGALFMHVPLGDNNQTAPLVHGHVNVKYTSSEVVKGGEYNLRVHLDVDSGQGMSEVSMPIADFTGERLDTAQKPMRGCGLTFETETPTKAKALKKMFTLMADFAQRKRVPWFPIKGWDTDYAYGQRPLSVGAVRYHPDGRVERGLTLRQHMGQEMRSDTIIEAACSGVPRGTLSEWQRGMSIYNEPGMELAQMLMLSGVANMLLPLISQKPGGIMLALSGRSGEGKSTLLNFLASFVGDPAEGMIPGSSTQNALVNMLSQAGFMLLPVDDSFKMDATSLSNLLSAVSSGMEKARMGQAESGGTWGTQTNPKFNSSLIVTTNFDISSVIGSGRSFDAQMDTDAARSRLLEVPSHFIKKPGAVLPAQWRDHEAAILANHGWALDVFARHVVPRQRVIADELHATENEVFTSLKAQVAIADMGLLRFWAKYLACVYIAGRVLTLDAAILPWDANAILRAGKELVVMADEEAKVEKESLVEALWSVLQDDVRERYAINRSWMITTPEGLWPHWDDTSADLTRGRLRRWDDTIAGQQLVKGTPVPGFSRATLNTPYDWRVTMTKVVATNGDTVRYEREVVITLQTLDNIVASNAGRTIKCGDWSEVYNAFETEGTVIGVKRGSPKRYGNKGTERCRIPIDAVPGVKGRGLRCVKLTWPPLDPSEVEPA